LIALGGSETISILWVEKDKQILLQSYERLGQSGLDHSKDKFLVQSCVVSSAFASKAAGDSNAMYEALTTMWNSVTSGGSTKPHRIEPSRTRCFTSWRCHRATTTDIFNKKLHVRHVVQDPGTTPTSRAAPVSAFKPESASKSNMENMSQDQLVAELSNLRRKYDELVSFLVNLTAERDILSNTLE
jgi:hypothetical protein